MLTVVKQTNVRRILLFSVLLFSAIVESSACFCDLKPAYRTKEDLIEYDFIALVRILRIDSITSGISSKSPIHKSKFEIIERFKGEIVSEVLVDGGHYLLKGIKTSCDFNENAGEEWVIFAYADKQTKKLTTHYCTRTFRYKEKDGYRYKGYGDENARLDRLKILFADGYKVNIKEGAHVEYYTNGQKELEENYINHSLDGKRTLWYPNGQLESTQYYKEGKKDGLFKWYSKNGQLLVKEKFQNDHHVDTTYSWFEIDTVQYKVKLFSGLHKITIDSAKKLFLTIQLRSKHIYSNTGERVYLSGFDRNGVLNTERIFDNEINKVTNRFYHDNGVLKIERYELHDKNFGIYREWNNSGEQTKYWEYDAAGKQIKESIVISRD